MAKNKKRNKKKVKSSKKNNLFRKFWRAIWITIIFLFVVSVLLTIAYRFINPPITILMIQRGIEQSLSDEREFRIKKDWVGIEDMSPNMIRAVITTEDNLFLKHKGFDKKAIKRAIEYNKLGKRIRGASTISQQTAKNVFLWSKRSWIRKGLETYYTILIEFFWSKERIMEVYLNVIEFGDGIYGIEAASNHYFHKSAKQLTKREAALLASVLPSPLKRNPAKPTKWLNQRASQVMNLMDKQGEIKLRD